jgi:hypothetical protein
LTLPSFGWGWTKRQLLAFARRGTKDFDVAVGLEQLGHRAGKCSLGDALTVLLAVENSGLQ